jgi:hypothetical protein
VKTKRQELGEVLAHLRGEAGHSRHHVADRIKSTTANVERIERGDLCPSAPEWSRYRSILYKRLSETRFRDLYSAAALEQLKEQEGISPADVAHPTPDLEAAALLVIEAIPNLRSCTIEIDDVGDIAINYRTRELRVVEDDGSLKITRKQGA